MKNNKESHSSFTSLRLNCWNIAQVIQKCKMLTNFSRLLTCYLTESYLLKKDKSIMPPPLMFFWEI